MIDLIDVLGIGPLIKRLDAYQVEVVSLQRKLSNGNSAKRGARQYRLKDLQERLIPELTAKIQRDLSGAEALWL
jgi:hypothetical protein